MLIKKIIDRYIIDQFCCHKEEMPNTQNLLLWDACNRYIHAITLKEQQSAVEDIRKLLGVE